MRELGAHLTQFLAAGKRVLWLVPGGSNIPFAVQVMAAIPEDFTKQLTIMLTDERYGPPGHADSNQAQLAAAGFDAKHGKFIPVLDGKPLAATARRYAEAAQQQLTTADTAIGQFGIGADGHIAGILPHSPGTAAMGELAVGYAAPDFVRLTLTFPALRYLETAYAFAYGGSKAAALRQLQSEAPLDAQPAQILKVIPETYVYNDQMEGEY